MRERAATWLALLVAGCASASCPAADGAIRFHVQTLDGTAIDDAVITCVLPEGEAETVPLRLGDYVCGDVTGEYDVTVERGTSIWTQHVRVIAQAGQCTALRTVRVVVALPGS